MFIHFVRVVGRRLSFAILERGGVEHNPLPLFTRDLFAVTFPVHARVGWVGKVNFVSLTVGVVEGNKLCRSLPRCKSSCFSDPNVQH